MKKRFRITLIEETFANDGGADDEVIATRESTCPPMVVAYDPGALQDLVAEFGKDASGGAMDGFADLLAQQSDSAFFRALIDGLDAGVTFDDPSEEVEGFFDETNIRTD